MANKKTLGQFFTKSKRIQDVFDALVGNKRGPVVEPAAGEGDLLKIIDGRRRVCAFECDPIIKPKIFANKYICGCFFARADMVKKAPITIVSNPPYVNIKEYTSHISKNMEAFIKEKSYKGRYNIAYLFIHKCAEILADGGEMIFIVPKDFSYATSANPLRVYLKNNGYFSHWIDCLEKKLFDDAFLESLVVFRWVKKSRGSVVRVSKISSFPSYTKKEVVYQGLNNTMLFLEEDLRDSIKEFGMIDDYFDVRVGSVSGCDDIFKLHEHNFDEHGCVKKFVSGPNKIEKYLNTNVFSSFDEMPIDIQEYLLQHEKKLKERYSVKNSKDVDDSWWRWSFLRNAKYSLGLETSARIYVFSKTRKTIFELGESGLGYVGGTYAMFPKTNIDLHGAVNFLNSDFYKDILQSSGLIVNNKFSATPEAIKSLPFPRNLILG